MHAFHPPLSSRQYPIDADDEWAPVSSQWMSYSHHHHTSSISTSATSDRHDSPIISFEKHPEHARAYPEMMSTNVSSPAVDDRYHPLGRYIEQKIDDPFVPTPVSEAINHHTFRVDSPLRSENRYSNKYWNPRTLGPVSSFGSSGGSTYPSPPISTLSSSPMPSSMTGSSDRYFDPSHNIISDRYEAYGNSWAGGNPSPPNAQPWVALREIQACPDLAGHSQNGQFEIQQNGLREGLSYDRASSLWSVPEDAMIHDEDEDEIRQDDVTAQVNHESMLELKIARGLQTTEDRDGSMPYDTPMEDDTDSDFDPSCSPRTGRASNKSAKTPAKNNRHRSVPAVNHGPHNGRRHSPGSGSSSNTSRVSKKQHVRHSMGNGSGRAGSTSQNAASQEPHRPFVCPLAPYGCRRTFTSKNEWKRHIYSQHICQGFWRCDLCPEIAPSRGPNDFNRKDLFTQHLRRMHSDVEGMAESSTSSAAASTKTKSKNPKRRTSSSDASSSLSQETIDTIRDRCWKQVRSPPFRLACYFCCSNHNDNSQQGSPDLYFTGKDCCEQWLEHVGKDLTNMLKRRLASSRSSDGYADTLMTNELHCASASAIFARDEVFRQWLIQEGVVEGLDIHGRRSHRMEMPAQYIIIDRGIASDSAHKRRVQQVPHEEQDAEGDYDG